MSRQVWLITDTHFNHDKMVEYCGRPVDHTERIIKNWQRLVKPGDLVIHLGDVIWNKAGELKGIMDSLPGVKVLVRGNHDYHHGESWWLNNGFDVVCQSMVFKNVLLTHFPQAVLPANAVLNVHGHFHNTSHHDWDCPVFDHNKLLAIENTKLCPVLFDEFVGRGVTTSKIVLV